MSANASVDEDEDDNDLFPSGDVSLDDEEDSVFDEDDVPDWLKPAKSDDENDKSPPPSSTELITMEEKHKEEMYIQREINRKYCARLKRRADLIAEIRKAYLRDIVTLKHVMNEQLSKDERVEVVQSWKKMIPSVDIRQHLMLYGPSEASFDTIPCDSCGGSVELVHHDSSEIEELSKALSHMDKNKDDLRLLIATKGAQLESIQTKMNQVETKHKEEKTVLYKEMKAIKTKSETVHQDNIQQINQIRVLREQLSEARVKAQQFDKVTATLNDTNAILNEAQQNIRNMEDATGKSRENLANLAEQLAVSTEQKEMAEAEVEKQAKHIQSILNISTKHKKNSDELSKKNVQLQKLFDDSRREVESLNVQVRDLEMNLEQQNEEMSGEIESLESMLDTTREEASTLNEELREVRYSLSTKTQEKENLQNSYNDLHFAKEEAVDRLEAQVLMLRARAEKAEEELGSKAGRFDSMEADLAIWKKKGETQEADAKEAADIKRKYEKMKKEYDKMVEADKDLRRKARDAKKKEEENEKKRLLDVANRPKPKSPEQKKLEKKSKREPSQKNIKDKLRRESTKKAVEKLEGEGKKVEQAKYVPHKRQRGKCRSSPMSSPSTSGVVSIAMPDADADDMTNENEETEEMDELDEDSVMDDMSALPPLPNLLKKSDSGVGGNRSMVLASTTPLAKMPSTRGMISSSSTSKPPSPSLSATSESPSGSVAISPSSSRDIYSRGGFELPDVNAAGGVVELSPILSFLRDEPRQMSIKFVLPSNDNMEEGDEEEEEENENEEEKEGGEGGEDELPSRLDSTRSESVDFSVSIASSMNNYDFGTNQLISTRLQKACRKLIIQKRLAEDVGVTDDFATTVLRVLAKMDHSEEDDMDLASSDDEIRRGSSVEIVPDQHQHQHYHDHQHNHSHGHVIAHDDAYKGGNIDNKNSRDLNDLVGGNMNIMPMSSEEMSVCSDVNCQHHDVNGELNEETAKIFGNTLKDVHYALESKFNAQESQVMIDLLAPKLMELSSITAKAQIGLWNAMKSTKLQTDFICKMAATCEKMIPFWGSDVNQMDIDEMADLHGKIASLEYFDQFREKWMAAVELDRNMMKKLSEKEWNEHLFLFVDLPSSCHFDYDEDREHSFDTALNAMLVMENFTEKMSGGVENLLTSLFLDWSTNKMGFLSGGGYGSGGGEAQMARISELNKELNQLNENFDNVKKEKDDLLAKLTIIEPDALRCLDLDVTHAALQKDFEELTSDNTTLHEKHSELSFRYNKLKDDHKKANEVIQQLKRELKSTQDVLTKTQTSLDERNAIQGAMQDELDAAREKERIRLFELVSSEMQTDPFIVDVGCQTEFIVPPMSLHHSMSTNISRTTPASSKRSFYPIVTPGGPAKGFMASIHDEFSFPEHNSISSSSHRNNQGGGSYGDGEGGDRDGDRGGDMLDHASATSILTMSLDDGGTLMGSSMDMDVGMGTGMEGDGVYGDGGGGYGDNSDYLDDKERCVLTPILMHHESDPFSSSSSRPGTKSSSNRGFNESIRMLNKISAAKHYKNLDVGLPSIQTVYSEVSSDAGSQTGLPQPLSGKLSPIKYVKPASGPTWGTSDTIRMHPRHGTGSSSGSNSLSSSRKSNNNTSTSSRSKSFAGDAGTQAITNLLEAHRRHQAPAHRKDMQSR